MKFFFNSLLIYIAFISCEKENGNNNNSTSLEIITGVDFREDINDLRFTVGNPNVKIRFDENFFPGGGSPNPFNNWISFRFENCKIEKIWVVPGEPTKDYQDIDFTTILKSVIYEEEDLDAKAAKSFSNIGENEHSINLENLVYGYYRIFVKTDKGMLWDNFYKYGPDDQDPPNFWK